MLTKIYSLQWDSVVRFLHYCKAGKFILHLKAQKSSMNIITGLYEFIPTNTCYSRSKVKNDSNLCSLYSSLASPDPLPDLNRYAGKGGSGQLPIPNSFHSSRFWRNILYVYNLCGWVGFT